MEYNYVIAIRTPYFEIRQHRSIVMNLQTIIPLSAQNEAIDYNSEIVLLGSCFAENIGAQFEYYKFKTLINPFGILFHPKAIETFLWMATQGEQYTETDLFFHNEQWHCFDAHSQLSHSDQQVVLQRLNNALATAAQALQSATDVYITLGTAWVYRLAALDMIVANCHKIPQKEFQKELLSITEIQQCLENSIQLIRNLNPKVTVTFTVSPVRHSKDGLVANTRSKSHLIAAIHECLGTQQSVAYFPAYELMMDELRDYRFYDADMLHPNATAIQYIWERFVTVAISPSALETMSSVAEVQKGLAHRPFNPKSTQHLDFLEKITMKKQGLESAHPCIQF